MTMNRNKRLVKQLAMKGENRKCFECGLKSTPYVIMDFGIFVCTKCSGIHRNFQHKVKGISMTNFKDEDIKLLKAFGGNEEARKKWRSKHDPKKYPLPKPADEYGVRKFVDQTFIAKRWVDDYYEQKPKKVKLTPKRNDKKREKKSVSNIDFSKKKDKKKKSPKIKSKKKDPFEEDPFDKTFKDEGDSWFPDFPDDKQFSKIQKTPSSPPTKSKTLKIIKKAENEGTGLEDFFSVPIIPKEEPKEVQQLEPVKSAAEKEFENDDGFFDTLKEEPSKKFPDLDKLFANVNNTTNTPPRNTGYPSNIVGGQPNTTNFNYNTPPQQPPTQFSPYQRTNINPGLYNTPPPNIGMTNLVSPYVVPQYHQGFQNQVVNSSNPFLVNQQPNTSNPFFQPLPQSQSQPQPQPSQQNLLNYNTNPNILGGNHLTTSKPSIPLNHVKVNNNIDDSGLGDFFSSSSKEKPKKIGAKTNEPDPFSNLLDMGF